MPMKAVQQKEARKVRYSQSLSLCSYLVKHVSYVVMQSLLRISSLSILIVKVAMSGVFCLKIKNRGSFRPPDVTSNIMSPFASQCQSPLFRCSMCPFELSCSMAYQCSVSFDRHSQFARTQYSYLARFLIWIGESPKFFLCMWKAAVDTASSFFKKKAHATTWSTLSSCCSLWSSQPRCHAFLGVDKRLFILFQLLQHSHCSKCFWFVQELLPQSAVSG